MEHISKPVKNCKNTAVSLMINTSSNPIWKKIASFWGIDFSVAVLLEKVQQQDSTSFKACQLEVAEIVTDADESLIKKAV